MCVVSLCREFREIVSLLESITVKKYAAYARASEEACPKCPSVPRPCQCQFTCVLLLLLAASGAVLALYQRFRRCTMMIMTMQ